MPNNRSVIDTRPRVSLVKDSKPRMGSAKESSPSIAMGRNDSVDQLFPVTLGAGMYIGIPILTYPEDIDIISSYSP